jgi:hypothetical protein
LRQSPFIPVRIIISSGQTFDILHPDLVLVVAGISPSAWPAPKILHEQTTRVPIMNVTALEDLPTTIRANN